MLKKYNLDPSHVLDWRDLNLYKDVSYGERPIHIMDQKEKVLCMKTIPLIKVLWQHHGVEEAT